MSNLTEQTKTHAGHDDAVPGNDKAHAHSHAAHLGSEGNAQTSPTHTGKQGVEPGAIQQPPQDPKRSGKAHTHQ